MVGFFLPGAKTVRTFKNILVALVVFFSAGAAEAARLNIAAASDMTFALKEIAASFEKDTGSKLSLTFGSTGMLARQIEEGAPFDAFLSADLKHMEALKKGGHVMADTVTPYARGRIVIAVNSSSGIKAKALEDLASPAIERIAIANPDHAPYGIAAMEALKSAGVWEPVKGRLVYGENIRQALKFVEAGNAQAGIIALSIAGAPGVEYTLIPEGLHRPISQVAAAVRSTGEEKAARRFVKYLSSPEARLILKRYGFSLP